MRLHRQTGTGGVIVTITRILFAQLSLGGGSCAGCQAFRIRRGARIHIGVVRYARTRIATAVADGDGLGQLG